jgi:hypothetical protein
MEICLEDVPYIKPIVSIRFQVPIVTLHDLHDRTDEDPLAMLSPQRDRNNWYRDTAPLQLTRLGILDTHLDVPHCLAGH